MIEHEPGNHYKVLFRADSRLLRHEGIANRCLKRMVRAIGCRPILGPFSVTVEERIRQAEDEPWADEGGITGIIVLSTSHVAIHTWPIRGKAVLDAYSCRPFKSVELSRVLEGLYQPTELVIHDLSDSLSWVLEG
jgi:S-adenosylmethionine/arginine decarboxylase-like enzyme